MRRRTEDPADTMDCLVDSATVAKNLDIHQQTPKKRVPVLISRGDPEEWPRNVSSRRSINAVMDLADVPFTGEPLDESNTSFA